jgi:HK97 gp10 family phage protein
MPLFKVEGLRELNDALAELPKATAKNVLKRALVKALGPMEAQAEGLAPELTGDLRAGINVGTKLTKRQMAQHRRDVGSTPVVTIGGFRSEPQTAVYVFMGPRGSSKSIVQEFGSVNQSPHPYMRPAWDSNKKSALESIKDDLAEEIDKAAKRLARKAAKQLALMK